MDPNLLLTVNVPALSRAAGGLPAEVIDVARLFDGRRVVASVLDQSHLTPRMTVAVVGRLLRMGILNLLEAVPEPVPELRWVAAPVEPPAPRAAPAPEPPPADDPLARALALAATLVLPPTVAPAVVPEAAASVVALEETQVMAVALPVAATPPPAVAPDPPGFDAADERFFGSYQPDPLPDDFVDLEDRPYSRRLASRRRAAGGWVSSFIGRLNSLLP